MTTSHKKILAGVVVLLFIISIGFKLSPIRESKLAEGCSLNANKETTCKFTVHNTLSAYYFHVVSDSNNTMKQIEINTGNNKTITQTLPIPPRTETPRTGDTFFQMEDINFDGYKDIKLLTAWGATGNMIYTYWLFDPSKNNFFANNTISLSNPTRDIATRTITTHSNLGMAGCAYNSETYRFDSNGKLVLTRSEAQNWVEKTQSFVKTISELKDSKMVIRTEAGQCK